MIIIVIIITIDTLRCVYIPQLCNLIIIPYYNLLQSVDLFILRLTYLLQLQLHYLQCVHVLLCVF